MVILTENPDQQALAAQLEALAGDLAADLTVQGGGDHMLAMVMDPVSKKTLWEYAGAPSAIVKSFRDWLSSRSDLM